MSFRDCFTMDISVRSSQKYSVVQIAKKLVTELGYRVVVLYRLATFFKAVRFPGPMMRWMGSWILLRLRRVYGVEFRCRKEIGPGLVMCHPHDIVIGLGCVIGRGVTIYNGVTLGAHTLKEMDDVQDDSERYPDIEDGVTIFPGAKIIGSVCIGEDSIVGANTVVNKSFPAQSTIAGVPAKLIDHRG